MCKRLLSHIRTHIHLHISKKGKWSSSTRFQCCESGYMIGLFSHVHTSLSSYSYVSFHVYLHFVMQNWSSDRSRVTCVSVQSLSTYVYTCDTRCDTVSFHICIYHLWHETCQRNNFATDTVSFHICIDHFCWCVFPYYLHRRDGVRVGLSYVSFHKRLRLFL